MSRSRAVMVSQVYFSVLNFSYATFVQKRGIFFYPCLLIPLYCCCRIMVFSFLVNDILLRICVNEWPDKVHIKEKQYLASNDLIF
jgi:hypothetical protein